MAFYKRINEEIQIANEAVYGPDFTLTTDTHEDFTYPVDGWYWYDTLDEALDKLPRQSMKVTRFQAKAVLHQQGLLEQAQALVDNSNDPLLRLVWNEALVFERNSPTLNSMAQALGLSENEIDQLFLTASQISA